MAHPVAAEPLEVLRDEARRAFDDGSRRRSRIPR